MHALNELTLSAAASLPVADVPPPQAPSFVNSAAIFGIAIFAAVVLSVVAGVKVIAKSDKQKNTQSLQTGTNVLIGWGIIVAAIVGVLSTWLVSSLGFFGSTG